MGRPTPETGGDTPQNQGLSEFKALPELKGVGPRVQKSEQPKQQSSNAVFEAAKHLLGKHWGKTVFEGPFRVPRPKWSKNPGEQRREPKASKPNPAEQHAAERLGKPPPEEEGEVVEILSPEVEKMIRRVAMGDPKEEARLRDLAKTDAGIRHILIKGPISLTYSPPDISILRKPEDTS